MWIVPRRPERRRHKRMRPHLTGQIRKHNIRQKTNTGRIAPFRFPLVLPSRDTTEAEPPSERGELESPGTAAGEDPSLSSKSQVRPETCCCTLIGCFNNSNMLFSVCLCLSQATAAEQDRGGGKKYQMALALPPCVCHEASQLQAERHRHWLDIYIDKSLIYRL